MSAEVLLSELERLGVRLEINGDRLKVEAPAHVWTPELRAKVVAAKADLLAALRRRAVYRIVVDDDEFARARTLDEALRLLAEVVRAAPQERNRTLCVKLLDQHGKALRLCYLPPWGKKQTVAGLEIKRR